MKTILKGMITCIALLTPAMSHASKFIEFKVIDKQYVMVHLRDGEVHYRDNGTGPSAFKGHSFSEGDDTLVVFGQRVNVGEVQKCEGWTISSSDDKTFGSLHPTAVYRKTKPMNTDNTLSSELDHWMFLQLPKAMKSGCHYSVTIPSCTGADVSSAKLTYDIYNAQSEAVHVNIIGYTPTEQTMHADLYQWFGDGGQRDYKTFEGKKVYLYNTTTHSKTCVGKVKFWKNTADYVNEAGKKNLVGTDVWNIDFKYSKPGTYRLVVEDVGCSMDFVISNNAYFQPYRFSVRGYYYMRLGEPNNPALVTPVPRQPQFIPETDPKGFTIYKTDLQPWCKEWIDLRTDVWDEPHFKPALASLFWKHRLPGNPVAIDVKGGHSDAMDWDRHLAHVANIYDMLLPYILTNGKLSDDNLSIRESGNGLPDIIDEARNEVDFFLSIRDGEAYSQGVTNPDCNWTIMYQAGCTTMAAWANAANCAIMAEAMRIDQNDSLMNYYKDEAIKAFRFAEKQQNQQLDDPQDIGSMSMRGRDFKQMAAAFLYNVTGDTQWEDIMAKESLVKDDHSPLFNKGKQGYYVANVTNVFKEGEFGFCQLYSAAAYLVCPHARHYADLYSNLCSSIAKQADSYNVSNIAKRPSRRAANDIRWQTSENLHLVILAHYIAKDKATRQKLADALYSEASWGLGRNPGNIVEMTGLGERHLTGIYTSGRNDGSPEVHPGQTPFNGTETWSPGNGGDASILLNRCYPSWKENWPRQESYFNQRYFWVNGEFTPRETMRGKMFLLGYLYGINKK